MLRVEDGVGDAGDLLGAAVEEAAFSAVTQSAWST